MPSTPRCELEIPPVRTFSPMVCWAHLSGWLAGWSPRRPPCSTTRKLEGRSQKEIIGWESPQRENWKGTPQRGKGRKLERRLRFTSCAPYVPPLVSPLRSSFASASAPLLASCSSYFAHPFAPSFFLVLLCSLLCFLRYCSLICCRLLPGKLGRAPQRENRKGGSRRGSWKGGPTEEKMGEEASHNLLRMFLHLLFHCAPHLLLHLLLCLLLTLLTLLIRLLLRFLSFCSALLTPSVCSAIAL